VLEPLGALGRHGFEVVKTEHLDRIDGQRADSLGQGEWPSPDGWLAAGEPAAVPCRSSSEDQTVGRESEEAPTGRRRRRWSAASVPVPPGSGTTPRGAVERRSLVVWSLAGALVVIVLVAALLVETGEGIESGSEVLAWEACRGEVLGRLREPSTAVFPPLGRAVVEDRDPRWIVTSHVDADNAFGQLARERWVCTIEFGGSGARLVELELTPVEADGG
jgi:hypothetical protein